MQQIGQIVYVALQAEDRKSRPDRDLRPITQDLSEQQLIFILILAYFVCSDLQIL